LINEIGGKSGNGFILPLAAFTIPTIIIASQPSRITGSIKQARQPTNGIK